MKTYLTKNWKTILISLILSFSFFAISSQALAQTQPPIIPTGATDKLYLPHDTTNVGNKAYISNSVLPGIASTIIGITGGLALLFVVVSGILYLTAYDPAIAEKAKKTLTYALAGLVVAGLSYAIVAIIASINVSAST